MFLSFSKDSSRRTNFSKDTNSFHQQSFKEIAKRYNNSNPFMYEFGYDEDIVNPKSPFSDFDSINKFNV